MADIFQRKRDHIALTHTGDVGHGDHRGLFEEVHLIHDALPELSMADLDLETRFVDHTLKAPLMLTGMTGGPPEAGDINRTLARICQDMGLPFGVGSQRIMTRADESTATFTVRDVAPDVILLGNVGINQARDLGPEAVRDLMQRIEADYMAIHLNPAMELVQPGADADRDFSAGYDTLGRLIEALDGKIIVKECGGGVAPWVVRRLAGLGVPMIDVSGSGGTSWVKVEALRAEGRLHDLGLLFADWGIPTAAATGLAASVNSGVGLIASGGITDGLTAARALAMGAHVAGMARPVLQALLDGGEAGARDFLNFVLTGLRTAMALTGSRTPTALQHTPRVLGARLTAWLDQGGRARR